MRPHCVELISLTLSLSFERDVISLIILAPALIASRIILDLFVSTDIKNRSERFSMTLITLLRSSLYDIDSDPGLVDCPPISMILAPCLAKISP